MRGGGWGGGWDGNRGVGQGGGVGCVGRCCAERFGAGRWGTVRCGTRWGATASPPSPALTTMVGLCPPSDQQIKRWRYYSVELEVSEASCCKKRCTVSPCLICCLGKDVDWSRLAVVPQSSSQNQCYLSHSLYCCFFKALVYLFLITTSLLKGVYLLSIYATKLR